MANNDAESPTIEKDTETYPEGGTEAWLVVLGSWCAMVSGMVRECEDTDDTGQKPSYGLSTVVYTFITLCCVETMLTVPFVIRGN